jgi:tyrosine decarboxylase/aspartate 1-decarboxylase
LGKRFTDILHRLLEYYESTPRHNNGRILGSMTTLPHPFLVYAYNLFIHSNAGDPELFPGLKYMMEDVLKSLSSFYGSPCSGCGLVVSGGTESNILALHVARQTSKNREGIVVAPDTVHVSVKRGCSILGCRLELIPTSNGVLDPSTLEEYIRRYKPYAVVVTAGTTERGLIDPLEEVAEITAEYNVYLHIDAAYGGLLIPFLYKHGLVDENLVFYPGVSSISIDFHKNGLTPIPSGVMLFSREEYMDKACYDAEYTISEKYCGLLGTRPILSSSISVE